MTHLHIALSNMQLSHMSEDVPMIILNILISPNSFKIGTGEKNETWKSFWSFCDKTDFMEVSTKMANYL